MHCAHVGNTWSRTRPWPQPTTAVIVSRPAARGCARCREREHGVQTPAEHLGHVTAVGGRMPTVGEDDLPLHEMSTNSKQTTCSPLHMVCEVHHTKSGYEQLKSRNSPFRPTRSLSSPKRMRYDRFRSRCEAAGHLPARGDRRFCRAARSQMGFSELAPASVEATKWLGDRRGAAPDQRGRETEVAPTKRACSPAFRYC